MSKKKILIVDHDPDILLLTKSRLEANGYESLTTQEESEVFKIAQDWKPDLILLDLLMPAMEGLEICSKLKKSAKTADIPILMFTVSAREDLELQCLNAGAKAIVVKPFDSGKLLSLIKKALDPASQWRKAGK